MAVRYSDDEPGSPWSWILYLDARADDDQQAVLEAIFTGQLGGDAIAHFPWAWKESKRIAVRALDIEVDHTSAAPVASDPRSRERPDPRSLRG